MIERMYDYQPEGAHLTITHPLPHNLTTITTKIGQLTVTIKAPADLSTRTTPRTQTGEPVEP